MKQKIILYLCLFCPPSVINAQQSGIIKYQPRLLLDFPVLELPYLQHAAGMRYNKRNDFISGSPTRPSGKDYLNSYENLSMQQTLAVTKNLHVTNYYLNNKMWNTWIKPVNRIKQALNRIAANASSGVIDYLLAYQLQILGPVWMHEEFHRSALKQMKITSHNDTYYRFNGLGYGGSVSAVKDEDLIRFKSANPQLMIRSFAAGTESQYELVRNMRKDNFFSKTHYANVAMNVLITKQAIEYVNQFKQKDYDASIDSMNFHDGINIATRDFVGWDFTGWVYDLFKPETSYNTRPSHPSGVGIQRAVKRTQLTKAEDDYLSKMGKMQYLNFLTPAMIGISRIKVNNSFAFNFAARHLLTSFGYDIGADVFLDVKGSQWFIGLHGYNNQECFLPGIEIEKPLFFLKAGTKNMQMKARTMFWMQPKNQLFKTNKPAAGGLMEVGGSYPLSKLFSFYAELEAKTKGWVAGNPYLDENVTFRTGILLDLAK